MAIIPGKAINHDDGYRTGAINMEVKYSIGILGTFVDSRDGQTYRTVQIGEQVWMAENLNYEDGESECGRFGRLYTWEAAKAACPSGWHLPSEEEFEKLIKAVGGYGVAGKRLKSKFGWAGDGNGTDDFCFSALPAGFRVSGGDFNAAGYGAHFWSATEGDVDFARLMLLLSGYDAAYLDDYNKDIAFSVRCLKDSD